MASLPATAAHPTRGHRPDGTGDPDSDLLVAVASGDPAAFTDLFDRFGGQVCGVARRVIRDPAQAEEISQEVFLEVWRTAPRFDPIRGSAAAWTITITRRRAVDRARSEQASRRRTRQIGVRDQQQSFDVVLEQVLLDEEHAEVGAALNRLTGLQRQVIELAYYQGHTYREVAEILDTPLGTVKTRIRDGLRRLKAALEESS